VFQLNPEYTFGGLLAGYTGTETAAADIFEMTQYGTYYFLIDEVNSICVLISGTNVLSSALTYPETNFSLLTGSLRGRVVLNYNATNTGSAIGLIDLTNNQTVVLPIYGLYHFSITFFTTSTTTAANMTKVGLGARTEVTGNNLYTNYLPASYYFNNCGFGNYSSSTNRRSFCIDGYYSYTNTSPSTLYLNASAVWSHSGGSVVSKTDLMKVYLVG
jgi:hypothetical protein